MKQFSFKEVSSSGYGGLIEKIEIMRSRLRLSTRLEQADIKKLLDEFNELRNNIMLLSRRERLEKAARPAEEKASSSVTGRAKNVDKHDLGFEGVLGDSPGILEALEIIKKAAPTDLPILIDGESGTGKELFARVIHANSRRVDKPFVSVNCGAIPDNLIESELFGHKRGAFTGAVADRKGHFEAADGGTIFLDEVGELPLPGQVKLLRVLQSQEVQRVGSDKVTAVDTRVVAATNRNLEKMAAEGGFREDLFYRLGVIHLSLPPLRERRDEIPLLCDYFFSEAAEKLERNPVKLTPGLRDFFQSYVYPGNIRELRNIVYRLSCLAEEIADVAHLPKTVHLEKAGAQHSDANLPQGHAPTGLSDVKKAASDKAERQFLENGLRETDGKVVELAKRLDMNRSHLQTLLKKHGLRSKEFRAGGVSAKR